MGLLKTLVNPGAGIISGLIQGNQQRKNIELQNRGQMNLAQYQYTKDLEMWNRQNAYNAPSEQMARFQQAGLNPNMIYGQGSAGNATQMPHFQAPELSYNYKPMFDPQSVLGQFQDAEIKNAQVDNLKAQRRILDAEATMKTWEANWAESNARSNATRRFNEAEAIKFKRVFSEEEFNRFFRYSAPDNKYYLKSETADVFDTALASRWDKAPRELARTNAEVARINSENDLKQKELQFLNSGGKYFSPIIQFLQMLKR